jgi:hypothetical protein
MFEISNIETPGGESLPHFHDGGFRGNRVARDRVARKRGEQDRNKDAAQPEVLS